MGQVLGAPGPRVTSVLTANPQRTKHLDFRGFDSSRFVMLRGGIPRPIGNLSKYRVHDSLFVDSYFADWPHRTPP